MQRRIAALVLAHRPAPLPYLARLLPPPFDIFVHYDAKSGRPPPVEAPNLRFVTPRRAVFWGGFSMVQATLDLLAAARAAGGHERYLLISGDALPLRPPEALAEALLWPDVEYIELTPLADEPATRGKTVDEITAMFGAEHAGRFHNFCTWDSLLTNPLTAAAFAAAHRLPAQTAAALRGEAYQLTQQLLGRLPPRPALFERLYYGSQWWALTADLVEWIWPRLAAAEVQEYFRFMAVPDEHFFSCLVGGSLREPIGQGRSFWDRMMRSEPSGGAGGVGVSAAALGAAAGAGSLFMRKFDPAAAPEVADAIRAGRYVEEILEAASERIRPGEDME